MRASSVRQMIVLGGVAISGIGLAACSSGSASPPVTVQRTTTTETAAPTTTTLSTAQYAAKYLAIVNPANAAVSTMDTQIQALPSSATAAQISPIVAPAAAAMNTAISQLSAVQWPGQTETDMRTLITDEGPVVGDLTALESVNGLTVSSVVAKLSEDAGTAKSAADIVHSDLGLPQSSS